MTAGIITNTHKDPDFIFTRAVCAHLQKRGAAVLLAEDAARATGLPEISAPEDTVYCESSFLAVLGGDGTMLTTAKKAAPHGTPMLGINLGTLGFLTAADRSQCFDALDTVLSGNAKQEKRMMLNVCGEAAERLPLSERLALNDICLSRGGFGKLITLELYINGLYMDTMRADGVIVATPTGSTAYNLSAGGPILSPESEMTVVTAICPHALHTRPMVIAAGDTVEITVREGGAVSLDGEACFNLSPGERLTVKRSSFDAVILKTTGMGFFEILRRKLAN